MKKITMTALVFAVLTMSNISAETVYACSGYGGGYGNVNNERNGIVLAGGANGGGYGNTEENNTTTVLAGTGSSGGYGHLDTSGRKKAAAGMIA